MAAQSSIVLLHVEPGKRMEQVQGASSPRSVISRIADAETARHCVRVGETHTVKRPVSSTQACALSKQTQGRRAHCQNQRSPSRRARTAPSNPEGHLFGPRRVLRSRNTRRQWVRCCRPHCRRRRHRRATDSPSRRPPARSAGRMNTPPSASPRDQCRRRRRRLDRTPCGRRRNKQRRVKEKREFRPPFTHRAAMHT